MYGTHLAAEGGHVDVLDYLLLHKADPLLTTCRGNTALHIAARSNQGECAKLLLRYSNAMWSHARLLWINYQYPDPDSYFSMLPKDMIGEITILLAQDCLTFNKILSLTNHEGVTALEYAMKTRSKNVYPFLMSPLTVRSIRGVMGSPLHYAADCGAGEACEMLLKLGCDGNQRNHRGETPLYRACCTYPENSDCVKVFLKYGVNATIVDNGGQSALDMAKARKYFSCVKLIEQYLSQNSTK